MPVKTQDRGADGLLNVLAEPPVLSRENGQKQDEMDW